MSRINEVLSPSSHDFYIQSQYSDRQYKFFPEIKRGKEGVREIISKAKETNELGIDFEFDPSTNQPSIIGVSACERDNTGICAACIYDNSILHSIIDSGCKLIAYAGTDADKRVSDSALGFTTNIDKWEDPLIRHYLCNPDYCSAPGKEEDDDDSYALGLMNLWTSSSQYTSLPNWKYCRDDNCSGPCPIHDVFAYCAVDAYAGHLVNLETTNEMRQKHIPEKLYNELKLLTVYCGEMQRKGIRIDRELVNSLEKDFNERKQFLFSHELRKKKRYFGKWSEPNDDGEIVWLPNEFNPNAPKDTYNYFASKGMRLVGRGGKASTNKADVIKALNRELKGHKLTRGLEFDSKLLAVVDSEGRDCVDLLPYELRLLANLALYKCSGKGLKSWFNEEYIDSYGFAHPRFIVTGSSTGRLSSANPNFQNIPRVGFGANVRRVLIPSHERLTWVKADVSGLEYRIIFWYAGQKKAPDTIFEDIVNSSEGKLVNAAKARNWSPRDVAKSLVHACITGDHEVLTPNGWIKISDWTKDKPNIAEWNNGEISFQTPKEFHTYKSPQKLRELHGRGISTVCTNNHGLPVYISGTWEGKVYNKLRKVEASSLPNCGSIPVCGIYANCDEVYSDEEICKAIAVQADGHYAYKNTGYVTFHLVKKRKQVRLEELFDVDGRIGKCENHKCKYYHTHFVSPLLTKDKLFTSELLKLSLDQRELFLDEILRWDGHKKKSLDGEQDSYFTTVYENAKWVQTIAHLTGRQALLRVEKSEGKKDCYRVSFNNRTKASISSLEENREISINWSSYKTDGNVYCFTTSSGYFLTRYRDRIHVTGNSNYFEGLKVLTDDDLRKERVTDEIRSGALKVYRDWTYRGGYVACTGANLAERIFGSRGREERKQALEIQDCYFDKYPFIRDFQKTISREIERKNRIQLINGHTMDLYGSPEDDLKLALASLGQGGGAIYVREAMLKLAAKGIVINLQVHDELADQVDKSWTDQQCIDHMSVMSEESEYFTGLRCPIKVYRGNRYKEGNAFDELHEIGKTKI